MQAVEECRAPRDLAPRTSLQVFVPRKQRTRSLHVVVLLMALQELVAIRWMRSHHTKCHETSVLMAPSTIPW